MITPVGAPTMPGSSTATAAATATLGGGVAVTTIVANDPCGIGNACSEAESSVGCHTITFARMSGTWNVGALAMTVTLPGSSALTAISARFAPAGGMTDDETARSAELFQSLAGDYTLIVVEHDMDFVARIADRVTVLHEGRVLAEGSMHQVQQHEQVIEVFLGR